MRQTFGSMLDENTSVARPSLNKELDEVLVNPFQERHTRVKRDKACLIALWSLSNVVTFMLGYYVKTKFNEDDCSIEVDGSL